MAIIHHLLNSTGRLDPYLQLIEEQLVSAIRSVSVHLSLEADVCVSHNPGHTNSDLGIGGGAFSSNLMHIFLDADHIDIESTIRQEILPVFSHEAHHCKRIETIPDDCSLVASLVTEGLACHFELDVAGGCKPSFIPEHVFTRADEYLVQMEPFLEDADFDYDTYFFGKTLGQYPKYAGFAAGFALVGRYLKSKSLSAAQAVAVPARQLRACK